MDSLYFVSETDSDNYIKTAAVLPWIKFRRLVVGARCALYGTVPRCRLMSPVSAANSRVLELF